MIKYYPEIDGLRAIAVLFVLAFHLNPNGFFTGGYVGVDIFFVISGYLITGIIYQSITNNNFNYFQFLNRRIARLYPALLFTILVIFILGFFIYSTEYYIETAKKIKYTLFSISNIKFMKQQGYWDISSTESPLLHTWSLGVEQQFYLIFPLILFVVYKVFNSKRSIIFTIIIISFLSICVAQYLSIKNPSANFYFTVSRLFELGIGGIFAIIGYNCKKISNNKKEALFSFGLALLLFCAIYYSSDTKYHPGVTTLPVVIGSVLCILYGDAKFIGRIVRTKVIVYIGVISYSIYLIHWPLITFYKYLYQQTNLNNFEQITLLLMTIAISALMYHLIESKYRRISISIFTRTGKVFLFIFIISWLVNAGIIILKGVPQRLIPYPINIKEQSTYAGFTEKYSNWNNELRILGDQNQTPIAIFVGDSYLGQYVEQIDKYFKRKNSSVLFIGKDGCLFAKNTNRNESHECKKLTHDFYEILDKNLPIIRINNWPGYLSDFSNREYILNEINRQQKLTDNKILIILPQPKIDHTIDPDGNGALSYLINKNRDYHKITYKSDLSNIKTSLKLVDYIILEKNILYIDTYDFFCDIKYCYNSENKLNGIFYYSYGDHLSRFGAKLVYDNIGDEIYRFILDNQKAH